jgi:hypothetical protein
VSASRQAAVSACRVRPRVRMLAQPLAPLWSPTFVVAGRAGHARCRSARACAPQNAVRGQTGCRSFTCPLTTAASTSTQAAALLCDAPSARRELVESDTSATLRKQFKHTGAVRGTNKEAAVSAHYLTPVSRLQHPCTPPRRRLRIALAKARRGNECRARHWRRGVPQTVTVMSLYLQTCCSACSASRTGRGQT